MTAGERLRLWRKQNNITSKEVAQSIGMSASGVTAFETNKASISHKYLIELNSCFGISIDWLLTGSQQDLPDAQKRWLYVYEQLNDQQREQLIQIAKTFPTLSEHTEE